MRFEACGVADRYEEDDGGGEDALGDGPAGSGISGVI